jgi:subtilisin family serine protease
MGGIGPTRYIVLRTPDAEPRKYGMPAAGARRRTRGASSVDAAEPRAVPTVEIGDLTPRAAADLTRKKDVVCLAPVFPMRLVAPIKRTPDAGAAMRETVWGVQAVGAQTSAFTGAGITVAVLDTGIDADYENHPAFKGVTVTTKNFTDDGPHDDDGHGTHCAGTILGRDVNGQRIGVARGVTKLLVGKVLGNTGGGSDRIIEAIQWAVRKGAHIISMSLGMDFPGFVEGLVEKGVPTALATSMALDGYRANLRLFESLASFVAAQEAFATSTLLVAAAGNESRRDENPEFQISVSPPAVVEGFVSVAAVGQDPKGYVVAPFSNVGARIAAPGVNIKSAQLGGGLMSLDGTSMATPHVVGVAALWAEKLAQTGQLKGRLLADRLVGTATITGMAPGATFLDIGAGLVQAPQS